MALPGRAWSQACASTSGRLNHGDTRVPATGDFFDVGRIVPDMNQAIVTEEFVAFSHDEDVVTILEKPKARARRSRANRISEKLTGNLNGRNWRR